jgi:hypothetical protein
MDEQGPMRCKGYRTITDDHYELVVARFDAVPFPPVLGDYVETYIASRIRAMRWWLAIAAVAMSCSGCRCSDAPRCGAVHPTRSDALSAASRSPGWDLRPAGSTPVDRCHKNSG